MSLRTFGFHPIARQRVRRLATGATLFTASLLAVPPGAPAQDADMDAVMDELVLVTPDPDAVTSAWWFPPEFFLLGEDELTALEEQEMMRVIGRYTLVGVVDGEIGPFGGVTFLPKDQMIASAALFDEGGTRYDPAAEDLIDPDVQIFLTMLRQMLSGMIGPMADNMAFLLFPARTLDGTRIADPLSEGRFSVRVGERSFDWETPLGSMLPAKYCPVDGRKLSGGWTYCPWHGAELVDHPPSG
jgi:hypothetical protein